MKLLLLRLEGVMQSWGIRSRWDVRDTSDEPTKSGIIGMLGCALGYPRFDKRLIQLDQSLQMGVRVENPGTKVVDYHTVIGELPRANGGISKDAIISHRYYLQDAAFLVVLSGDDETLERCAQAIQYPVWPLYLGRKACVMTRPPFEDLTDEYASIEDALMRHPWQCDEYKGEPPEKLRCIVEAPRGPHIRQDKVPNNPARMYGMRRVKVFFVDNPSYSKATGHHNDDGFGFWG